MKQNKVPNITGLMYHFKFKHDNEKSIFIRKFEKLWSSWDHIFDFLLSKFIVCWFLLVAFFGGFGVFFGSYS